MVRLLAEHREARTVHHDVIPLGGCGPEAVDPPGLQRRVGCDRVEELVRRREEIAGDGPLLRIVEDRRVAPLELPRMEEEGPVDVPAKRRDVLLDDTDAGERRCREVVDVPVDRGPPDPRLTEGQQRLPPLLGMERAQALLVGAVLGIEPLAAAAVEEVADDADDA
jgi:hypothetical protein